MRRRRGGGAAPAEPCGVWLDTAELKRGPARPLSAKPKAPTRTAQRKLPRPGTRQSTIPTFFSPHTDDRDKENSRPAPCTPNKDCEASGAPLAACPVKILALPRLERAQEEPPGAQQGVQGSWKTPQAALELQGESQSQSKSCCGAGEDSWCCSFCQGSEHSRIITPRNKSQLFPAERASGSRTAQPWGTVSSGLALAGTENTNPGPGAAPSRVCCSPQSPGRAQPLRELGQALGGACRQLWCQESQGSRVIAHRGRASSPSPRQQQEPGSEPLFTQDSEGNRVIKH
ncbi:aurora kinase A and ninein-interacting protein-like [Catharus ustulatus]|uniref:aurora kinase A and ninein-interacting protein-like n=1 Tax=Catharus ustulatus TaxID=91951 RepID=UPI00140D266E|nr:aurora kinase A and ninein-interacting protein-like [Catharus ustulatus]